MNPSPRTPSHNPEAWQEPTVPAETAQPSVHSDRTLLANAGYSTRPDAAERERLLLEQLPQVRYIARRIHERLPAHVLLEDLVQAGVMGLIDAVHKYDPAKNAQLTTYARFRIRGAILDSLRALDWSPRELRRQGRALQQATERLQNSFGRQPSEQEVADELGMTTEEFQRLQSQLNRRETNNTGTHGDDPNAEGTNMDALVSPQPDPFTLCQRSELKTLLAQLIEELPERERQMLSLYYFEELTMKEVGAVLGVGESRVSQLHAALLGRLKDRLRDRYKIPNSAVAE